MLNLNSKKFAENAADCLYDLKSLDIPKENAIASIHEEIENLLSLNEHETLVGRHSHFNIPGTEIQDYEEHFYEIDSGKNILAGIRHKGGDIQMPFVHTLMGFDPTNSDIIDIIKFSRQQFKKFNPRFVSIWIKPSLKIDFSKVTATQSRQYVVGSISEIKKMKKPANFDIIKIEKVTSGFDFDWYTKAYAEFHEKQPNLKTWVPITDNEDIERAITDQLMYRVLVNEKLAGIIAAHDQPLLNKKSAYMVELLLTNRFKNQGLAPAFQRKFIETLSNDFNFIWGTIDAKNQPSLKTALRVGRIPIRSEYFIEL